uniref:Uncharacterized protein n=1 Tax=Rhipicephalus zambeziensis TaxID=60191 RepID=A0A224YJQ3_9ACAR
MAFCLDSSNSMQQSISMHPVLMANSTGRAGATFLAPQPRICIPLVDSEQVRVFHWQIRSNLLRDGTFRVAPSCRGGFSRNSGNALLSFTAQAGNSVVLGFF